MSNSESATPVVVSFSRKSRNVSGRPPYAGSPSSADQPVRPLGRVHFTPRQLQVLELLVDGLPNKMIARRLNISASTVKCYIAAILRELSVESRLQAVVVAYRWGLVNAPGS
jgi:DNA-binding NarL/FixJ family response regulator